MKKILLAFLLTCSFSFGQSVGQTIEKGIELLTKDKNSHIKPILTETITLSSITKSTFGGGNTRAVVKVNLPPSTKTWFYRITVMDVNTNYSYPESESYYTILKKKKPHIVAGLTTSGIDFHILDKSSVNAFLADRKNDFLRFSKYSKYETPGFVDNCELISNDIWIGLNNPNLRQGMKVIVEIVAMGYY